MDSDSDYVRGRNISLAAKPRANSDIGRSMTADCGPNLVILPLAEVCRRHDEAAKSDPVEITSARWREALEVLPPVGYRNDGLRESFKMGERITGPVTSIYVRLGDQHFSFADNIRTPTSSVASGWRNPRLTS